MKNLFRIFYYLIVRTIFKKPLRYFLTTLGVASGIALFFSIEIINHSAVNSLEESVGAVMGETDLTLKSNSGHIGLKDLERIEKMPEVRFVSGSLRENTYFYIGDSPKKKINILAIDLLKEGPFRSYKTDGEEDIIDDPIEFLNTPNGIIISRSFAQKYNLSYGSELDLLTSRGRKTFEVGGILNDQGVAKAFGGSLAIMDLMAAQFLFGNIDKVTSVDIILWDKDKVSEVKKIIQERLSNQFTVNGRGDQVEQMKTLTKSFRDILNVIGIFTWLMGLFVVYSSVKISVGDRVRELGILRSLGSDKSLNLWLFVIEAAVIGFVGSILAIGLGQLLSGEMVSQIFQSFEDQFKVSLGRELIDLPNIFYLRIILVSVATSILAGLLPAWTAANVDPLLALKSQEMDENVETYFISKVKVMMALVALLVFVYAPIGLEEAPLFIALRPILGMVAFVLLLKPFVWLNLNVMMLMTRKIHPVLWLSVKNLQRKMTATNQGILRLTASLTFILFLFVIKSSVGGGVTGFFKSKEVTEQVIMSDGEMFNMQMIPFDYGQLKELEKIEGLKKLRNGKLITWRHKLYEFKGKKIGVTTESGYYDLAMMKKGAAISELGPDFNFNSYFEKGSNQILASTTFLKKFNYKVGDQMSLSSPLGQIKVKIVGSYLDFADSEGNLHLNNYLFYDLFNDNQVYSATYRIQGGYNKQKVNEEVENALLSKMGLKVVQTSEIYKSLEEKIEGSLAFLDAIVFVSLFVTFMGLFTPILFQTLSRQREFGVIRSNGLSLKGFGGLLFAENLTIVFIGIIYGLTIGLLFIYVFFNSTFLEILPWYFPTVIPPYGIFIVIGFGILLGITTIIYPVFKLRKLPINEMISYE